MHVYFYDPEADNPRYSKLLAGIETRITDLGLNGKIVRLGVMKNINEAVRNEVKRGAKTLIVVGGDNIINQALNNIVFTDIPLGIIPLAKGSDGIAKALGIEHGVSACDTLSARRIELLDLGKINESHFLSQISFNLKGTKLSIEDKFTVETKTDAQAYLVNLPAADLEKQTGRQIAPNDGLLQLIIKASRTKGVIFSKNYFDSIFTFEKLTVSNHNDSIRLDSGAKISLPARVKIVPNAIRMIVGKNREF